MNRAKFILTALAVPAVVSTAYSGRKPKNPFIVPANKNQTNGVDYFQGRNLNNVKISKENTDGGLCMYEYVGYDKIGPGLHVHLKQDEIFYVVEGSYRFVVGERTEVLGPGDTIFLPRNIPHTWIQLSDFGKLIYALTPAGKFEDFFDKLNSLKAPLSQTEFDELALAHDIRNVGPPLTL